MGWLSSAVGNLTGGIIGTSDAEKAAKSAKKYSAAASNEAKGYVDDAWSLIEDTYSPYAAYGQPGMEAVAGMQSPDAPQLQQFNFNQQDLLSDPSYQFRLSQGLQAADRAFAKNRNLGAGNRLIGLNDYAQNMASTEYQNAWQRALAANTANNQTLANQYGLAANKYGLDLGRNQYLSDVGFGAGQRLADYKYRTGIDKGNLAIGNAANSTAADMFQAQNKSQFVSDLFNLGGSIWGAKS